MSDNLPQNKSAWRREAIRNGIDFTQSLIAGNAFVSGSKFKFEHFLRLRVLYIEARAQKVANSPGFPKEHIDEVKRLLEKSKDTSFLKTFLKDEGKIERKWTLADAIQAGTFAIAMEHVHIIAQRGVDDMNGNEDIVDRKIISSPPKTRSMTLSGLHQHGLSMPIMAPSTPTPQSRRPIPPSNLIEGFSMLSMSPDSPEEIVSRPGSDVRQAMNTYERVDFTPGDEQTVNAALVALIMALSWLLGYTGRVHHDRMRFSIPKDAKTYLYSACVDGIIKHLEEDKLNGFMEVKRDFRSNNSSVRRQIAAQMAAFIYEQDVVLAGKATEENNETESRKKTEKDNREHKTESKAKEDRVEDNGDGSQEQFRKWMVSMDGFYTYINIATYDRQYVDYLSGSPPPAGADDAFMEMVEYGKYDLRLWSGNGLELFLTHMGALMKGGVGP